MHPASTAFLILGYALALPIGMRMASIVSQQHRLAFTGHQVGVGLALLGWVIRGSIMISLIHVVWLVGVRLWFQLGRPQNQRDDSNGSADSPPRGGNRARFRRTP